MSTTPTNAPDTGRPLTRKERIRFGVGFLLFSLLWMTAGTSGSQVLLPQRFTELGIGSPAVILGTMNSVGCVFALVANWFFGALSDMSHSRFGKRTPWIIIGGFVTAAGYLLTSQANTMVLIVSGWCVVQVGVNMMIAPTVAILSDRIPEANRGVFSALYGGGSIVGQSLGTLIGAQLISKIGLGFMVGVALFAITGVAAVLILPRERSAAETWRGGLKTPAQNHNKIDMAYVARSFTLPTRNCRNFYFALVGRLLLITGWQMVSSYQLYILQQYCGLGKEASAAAISMMSIISMLVLIFSTLLSGYLSDRLQRRKVVVVVGSVIIAAGLAVPIVMPTAFGMMVYAGVAGVGYGIYTSVDQALNVDVLPNKDQAGKDLGILNLANTIGQVLSPVIVSVIVISTNNYAVIFPAAILSVLVGAGVIMGISSR